MLQKVSFCGPKLVLLQIHLQIERCQANWLERKMMQNNVSFGYIKKQHYVVFYFSTEYSAQATRGNKVTLKGKIIIFQLSPRRGGE